MPSAALNISCTSFFVDVCFTFSWIHTQEWNCWVIWQFFWGTVRLCTTVVAWFYNPSFVWVLISPGACVHLFFHFYSRHSIGYKAFSHCDFDLHFPDDRWCWPSFHMLIEHLFWRNVCLSPLPVWKLGCLLIGLFITSCFMIEL